MIKLFSSESVTEGHPDKICDQISDAILDEALRQDPYARVACETAVKTDLVFIFGEITTNASIHFDEVIKKTIKSIGYDQADYGFSVDSVKINIAIDQQSADIAQGVNETKTKKQGAGDQGLMFGYANDDTDAFMPLPIYLAHRLAERLTEVRKKNIIKGLRPDGKVQVTVAYDQDDHPLYIHTVVLSTQHDPDVFLEVLRPALIKEVITPILSQYDTSKTDYKINPTGRFVIGGPKGDGGLTGRKIIVDTYGGYARHGGGAFSGKDPSKVDRSAAYMARYIAKNIVASKIATQCEIQIAYAIGVAEPVSLYINTFGTEKVDIDQIYDVVNQHFDLTPKGIIDSLDLRRPIYEKTATYGHFGRNDVDFTWEKIDKIELFAKLL